MTLLELQRRMAEDVGSPLTSDYEMQKTTENGGSTEEIATSYIAPNQRLSSFERLEIYNRQYWFRLISEISDDFPTLNVLLGPKQFDALIPAYLAENPSMSWTLRNLGSTLSAFLDAHPEFTGRRHRLAVDVARLEWAYVEAFEGQHLDPVTAKSAGSVSPDSSLLLQPHLQLLELSYPVDTLLLAVKKGTPETDIVSSAATQRGMGTRMKLPAMKRRRVYLAVHRFEESVYYRRIARETFLLLRALRAGASVAQAVTQAFKKTTLKAEGQAELLHECFAHAAELSWLCPSPENTENPST